MDPKCECPKVPCICGAGLCSNRTSKESAKIQTVDENGVVHYVESIYKKIPVVEFENVEVQQSEDSTTDGASTLESIGDSNLNPIIKEEKEESIGCNECCEHIYAIRSPDEIHECKTPCNITAELYCQIKRQNAEPDEKLSMCSGSTIESDDSGSEFDSNEDNDENNGDADESTLYLSAQGKTEDIDDNSEETFPNDDEDAFDPSSAFHSTLIDENRIQCQDEKCCALEPNNKCRKHHKHKPQLNAPGDQKTTEEQRKKLVVTNISNVGDSNDTTETKWTTIQPSSSRENQRIQQNDAENEKWTTIQPGESMFKTEKNSQTQKKKIRILHPEEEARNNEGTVDVKPPTSILKEEVNNKSDKDETTEWATIQPENHIYKEKEGSYYSLSTPTGSSYGTKWKTDVGNIETASMASKTSDMKVKLSDILWTTENANLADLIMDSKSKPEKHVTLTNEISSEIKYNAQNRKRKYGSIPDVLPETAASLDPETGRTLSGRSFSYRRKRMTVADFVPEEQLIDIVVPDVPKPQPKPEHTDAYYLLESSSFTRDKRLWNTMVPSERSDFAIVPTEAVSKKSKKKGPPLASIEKQPVIIARRTDSFFRQKTVPFKPRKLLCFKYIPSVSPKTSSASIEPNLSISQLYIDPPEFTPQICVIPLAKSQGSRIPVSISKHKTDKNDKTGKIDKIDITDKIDKTDKIDQKESDQIKQIEIKKASILDEGVSGRRVTLGKDEIRNVVVQKSNLMRRSIIPPELRKSLYRSKSISRKSIAFNFYDDTQTPTPFNQMPRKSKKTKQKVTLFENPDDGSDSSLRNKMKKYYPEDDEEPVTRSPDEPAPTYALKQETKKKKFTEEEPTKTSSNKPEKINNILQKTCCSQTGIHVCIKESTVTENGIAESNILQMVNIDVTPKNFKSVKVNVMPTVPEINKEGIITIPVQFKISDELSEEEKQKIEPPEMSETARKNDPEEELLYQKCFCEHYIREEQEDTVPEQIPEELYFANLLSAKMMDTLSVPHNEEDKSTQHGNNEIQTDQTLLSKSLNSLKSDSSSSTVQNKSDPVHRTGIDWNDILLPPPGSIKIKKSPIKKLKRRYSQDHDKPKDSNGPTTSKALPPTEELPTKNEQLDSPYPKINFKDNNEPALPLTEEIPTKNEQLETPHQKSKFKCCCSAENTQDEPYTPANDPCCVENDSTPDEPECKRSKIISLVFPESFYENKYNTNSLPQSEVEEERLVSPCTSKPEIPWTNILLPDKPQIRKIEKVDTSKTSTSITDQIETSATDEYNSMSPSPKETDTCPNLSEDSTHICDCDYSKSFNDKGTNTTTGEEEEDEEVEIDSVSYTRNQYEPNKITTNSTVILKAFKEDPVLSAFKAFEEELRPVRKALAEVQSKLRALNIPELECLFKKDPISEYPLSRSNSQIIGDWRQPICKCPCDNTSYLKRPSNSNRNPSPCFRQIPSDLFDYNQEPSNGFKIYRITTPPIPVRSRHLSTDIWKAFGSCERNTIKGHYEKFWQPPHTPSTRNTDRFSCPYAPSANYNSRNSTPESDIKYVSFDSSRLNNYEKCYSSRYFPNMYDKRVEIINDDDDLDYPSIYRNTPTSPHACSEQNCFCDSDHSLHSSETERLDSNHILTSIPPKFSSNIHIISDECSNRYIPVKVTPVTPYFMGVDAGLGLHNSSDSSKRNISTDMKNGIVYARKKIELPDVVYKRGKNMDKNVRKHYSQKNNRNQYSHSEYDTLRYNNPSNNCTCEYPLVDDNLPNFPCYYKEYLPKERYI